jgi:hypothetical protein
MASRPRKIRPRSARGRNGAGPMTGQRGGRTTPLADPSTNLWTTQGPVDNRRTSHGLCYWGVRARKTPRNSVFGERQR